MTEKIKMNVDNSTVTQTVEVEADEILEKEVAEPATQSSTYVYLPKRLSGRKVVIAVVPEKEDDIDGD